MVDNWRFKDQLKFISNKLYTYLNTLHYIFLYQKLYIHHWYPTCYFWDTTRGFKFGTWVGMTWGRADNLLREKRLRKVILTHLFPMHPFSTPWKHQKTLRFSDVFWGLRKGALETNGLIESRPYKNMLRKGYSKRRRELYKWSYFYLYQVFNF